MQGRISLTSKLNEGSQFVIELEMESLAGSGSLYQSYQLPELPHNILIVGNLAIEMAAMVRTLQAVGMTAQYCSASQAFETIKSAGKKAQPFDTLILDLNTAAARTAKLESQMREALEHNNNQRTPIKIVVFDVSERGEFPDLQAKGIDAYLTRPVRPVSLFARLNQDYCTAAKSTDQNHSTVKFLSTTKAVVSKPRTPDGPVILLAEDNEINALLARTILKKLGVDVRHVSNGQEAVDAVKEMNETGETLDYILMDIHMPEMDGFTATETIRSYLQDNEHSISMRTPIIAMTANAFPEDREKCLAAGMNDHLAKPFESAQLQEILEKWNLKNFHLNSQRQAS